MGSLQPKSGVVFTIVDKWWHVLDLSCKLIYSFSGYRIASPRFEQRAKMLFKRMKTVEQTSGTKMEKSKILYINIKKNLRI